MKTTMVIALCLISISLECIALALCDVAETLGQLGAMASAKAHRIKQQQKGQQQKENNNE